MDHRKKRPQRRKRRRAKNQRPRWLILLDIFAFPLTIIGLVLVLTGFALNLPQDKPALDDNTRLHQSGTQVVGRVAMVEKEHHRSKHGDYDVFTPFVTLPVHGAVTTVELDAYAVIDQPTLYREGKQFPMLVAPHVRSDRDIGIADQASRERLAGAVRGDIIRGSVGAVMLLIGAPSAYIAFRTASNRKGRPRTSGPRIGDGDTLAVKDTTIRRKKANRA
ncbi:hypothetical protein [Curtobacterium sp. MCSS17_016]|uniref:hypothetical protein n=1 Tax=Curtobacterium sp. MCSS17_016 TaxID=2175644 RepID=UPI000DAA732A|nr:hypothetical protein [Curtobacterium sp. MCSS17_016]WIE81317.1 hypothetical protein DEJ19_018970 [Curtobacterium sp. MCSS17_016]